ncbi:hypothetical protein MW887_009097 [Aspergillus wentii]|nr:hypothetical protein MW887_009097 [Aspergillus wentii]
MPSKSKSVPRKQPRWTEEERSRLWDLRSQKLYLSWDKFHRLYFPDRSMNATVKAYSDMKLAKEKSETPRTSSTKPPKTMKRPLTEEGSAKPRVPKKQKADINDGPDSIDVDSDSDSGESTGGDLGTDGKQLSDDVRQLPQTSMRNSSQSAATTSRTPLASRNRASRREGNETPTAKHPGNTAFKAVNQTGAPRPIVAPAPSPKLANGPLPKKIDNPTSNTMRSNRLQSSAETLVSKKTDETTSLMHKTKSAPKKVDNAVPSPANKSKITPFNKTTASGQKSVEVSSSAPPETIFKAGESKTPVQRPNQPNIPATAPASQQNNIPPISGQGDIRTALPTYEEPDLSESSPAHQNKSIPPVTAIESRQSSAETTSTAQNSIRQNRSEPPAPATKQNGLPSTVAQVTGRASSATVPASKDCPAPGSGREFRSFPISAFQSQGRFAEASTPIQINGEPPSAPPSAPLTAPASKQVDAPVSTMKMTGPVPFTGMPIPKLDDMPKLVPENMPFPSKEQPLGGFTPESWEWAGNCLSWSANSQFWIAGMLHQGRNALEENQNLRREIWENKEYHRFAEDGLRKKHEADINHLREQLNQRKELDLLVEHLKTQNKQQEERVKALQSELTESIKANETLKQEMTKKTQLKCEECPTKSEQIKFKDEQIQYFLDLDRSFAESRKKAFERMSLQALSPTPPTSASGTM